jgi:branched-chain amino acid transport system permease protein
MSGIQSFTVETSSPGARVSLALMAAFAVVMFSMPLWGESSLMHWCVEVICFLVLALMWNLMAGYGGLVSVGQQAFVGLGGYGLFVLAQHMDINPFVSVLISAALCALLAIPMAKVFFRLKGGYFAIGTWVGSEIAKITLSNIPFLGAGSGQSLTVMVKIPHDTRENITYWMATALLFSSFIGLYVLLRSRFGLGLTAIRDSEAAAESQGVPVDRLKLQVFVLSAFGSGLVGALYYLSILRISPSAGFDLAWVVAATFIVVIGGIGTLEGPIVGCAVFFMLRWFLADYGVWYWLIMGVVAITVMIAFPKGIWGFVQQKWGYQLFPLQRKLIIK